MESACQKAEGNKKVFSCIPTGSADKKFFMVFDK